MQALITKILGNNPKTSLTGILVAALGIAHETMKAGETNWMTILMAIVMGLMGLTASDAKSNSTQDGK